jgi:hypothetical protein
MQTSNGNGKDAQLELLAQVRGLANAIQSAISAIEKNDLAQFQDHLAMQEKICNRLSCLRATVLIKTAKNNGESGEAKLQQELLQACSALAKLNRVYSALLKRAQKSVDLMAAIYASHGTGYGSGHAGLGQNHTWSCEG